MTSTTEAPNPADFSINERPNEYYATLHITGQMRVAIQASSQAEAERIAEETADKIADDPLEVELDDLEDVLVDLVAKERALYRVTRDGRKMQVSRLEPGDLPREPDERGF